MTPSPTPTPALMTDLVGTILVPVGHGLWLAATASAWSIVAFGFFIVVVMTRIYRSLRWTPIANAGLDPLRRFGGPDRAALFSRACGQCERHGLLFGRCKVTENLHADHIHPHSKGGTPTVANGQVLCSRHNKLKAARIPFNWELRRLERQRALYFPAAARGAVIRRSRR